MVRKLRAKYYKPNGKSHEPAVVIPSTTTPVLSTFTLSPQNVVFNGPCDGEECTRNVYIAFKDGQPSVLAKLSIRADATYGKFVQAVFQPTNSSCAVIPDDSTRIVIKLAAVKALIELVANKRVTFCVQIDFFLYSYENPDAYRGTKYVTKFIKCSFGEHFKVCDDDEPVIEALPLAVDLSPPTGDLCMNTTLSSAESSPPTGVLDVDTTSLPVEPSPTTGVIVIDAPLSDDPSPAICDITMHSAKQKSFIGDLVASTLNMFDKYCPF